MEIENLFAFPSQALGGDGLPMEAPSYGLTMRDYFAGQALAGILASGAGEDDCDVLRRIVAIDAFGYADAMLLARSRPYGEQAMKEEVTVTPADKLAADDIKFILDLPHSAMPRLSEAFARHRSAALKASEERVIGAIADYARRMNAANKEAKFSDLPMVIRALSRVKQEGE